MHYDDADVVRLRTAVARIARRLDRQAVAAGEGEGRPRTQLSILATVASRERIGLGELADIEGINPTMLSRIVGRLEDDGLLRRVPDPDDRRSVHAEITPAGAQLHASLRAERTRLLAETLDLLGRDEASALLGALPALESLAAALQHRVTAGAGAAS